MATEVEHVQKALDTLMELCDPAIPNVGEDKYDVQARVSDRRNAATEILAHYRDERFREQLKEVTVTLNVNGAIPVRPMTRFEMERS
jgi:hypothetical protein